MTGLEKGKALFEKQEFEKAIDELNNFLSTNENNADALYTRAMCYRKTEAFDKSVEDLTAILRRLPNEPTLLCDRGITHFHNKNFEAALKDMDKAVEIDPNNPYRYSSRAFIRAEIDINGAMEDYEKAIELDPKDDISLNNLGLLQENAGNMKAAKKNYKKSDKIIGYNPEKRKGIQDNKTKKENVQDTQKETFGKVILSIFSSKSTRNEYFKFLKSLFKK